MLAEHAADQIGAALAIEHGVEQLDAAYRRVTPMGQIVLQAHRDRRRAAQLVGIGNVEAVVGQHPLQRLHRPRGRDRVGMPCDRMGDGIGRFNVEGDELQRRVHATGGEQAPRQGVVEGLVQLGIDQLLQQGAVARVHLQPQRARADRLTGEATQGIHLLGDAQVVQGDALDGILAGAGPVALLEALPRTRGSDMQGSPERTGFTIRWRVWRRRARR
ncbi:hypothetical protein G6F59_014664 [Rhizopus arrhizus]|nr:hypothetical protein G6F59_014664 [Rhizopus arrhizus]